ncbi:MAG: GNAT family N-acetyltransferase [Salaquimonas sp.]
MSGFLETVSEPINDANATGPFSENTIDLAEITSIDGGHWKLCLHPFEYKRSMNPDLSALLADSSTNPFFNTAFLAASRDRMTQYPLLQLIMWEITGEVSQALFSAPMVKIPAKLLVPEHFKSFTHEFAPFGDPLIDQQNTDECLQKLSALLKVAFDNGVAPIVFDYISDRSNLQSIEAAESFSLGFTSMELGSRAAIQCAPGKEGKPLTSKKRARELRRQLKNLQNEGEVTFEKATDRFDIMLRFEEFLLMETQGWKGRRGSSIHVIKKHAAFARQAVNDLATEGICEIFTMRFNGKCIASTILFKSGGFYFPWKTTYDHLFSRYSPGSQLMIHLTNEIVSRDNFVAADSLAGFGQSWMNHLWPDTTTLSRFVFAADQEEAGRLLNQLHQKEGIKAALKKLLRRS